MAALLATGEFAGYPEGHFFDLLAHLHEGARLFHVEHSAEYEADTMLARVDPGVVDEAINDLFIATTRALFGPARWADWTPSSNAVNCAPRLLQIWPRA